MFKAGIWFAFKGSNLFFSTQGLQKLDSFYLAVMDDAEICCLHLMSVKSSNRLAKNSP